MQECFWNRSNELSRKHWEEKVGNRRWRISTRKSGSIWAGSIPDLRPPSAATAALPTASS